MKPYYQDERVTILHGDALDVLRSLPDASVDSVVTDPPYGLEFMGKDWDGADGFRRSLNPADVGRESVFGRTSRTSPEYRTTSKATAGMVGTGYTDGAERLERPSFLGGLNPKCLNCGKWQRGGNPCSCDAPDFPNERLPRLHTFQQWCEAWATECLRVLKPGGHLLAFGGTRTWHRLACAVEDAGFEVRDSIAWLYGSGFPKSLDVSKAIDKAAGAERRSLGIYASRPDTTRGMWGAADPSSPNYDGSTFGTGERHITAPATPDAERWQGWGTALKPSHEPVVVARKPHVISGILDGIGSELARLEDECRPSANGAARSSAPTPAASPEARTATAPASAATPHEAGQEPTTPTGAAAGSSAQTATSWSDEAAPTPWSTVSSWRACWAELCELTSTSTTSTTTEVTTDLRTLWSSISSLTVTSTPGSPTPALTSGSTASAVDSLFAATVLRLRATLALSATESATGSTPHVPQAAGGSSAFEPVVVARKPLAGTVAQTVLEHGTGALNIDGCRVGTASGLQRPERRGRGDTGGWADYTQEPGQYGTPDGLGRWPTNVVLDDSQAAELDRQSGERQAGARPGNTANAPKFNGNTYAGGKVYDGRVDAPREVLDSGGASRFFPTFRYEAKAPSSERPRIDGVAHPTVKPLDLCRWLVRLVTPPGGTVLEPFAGSGTTVEACIVEGFHCIAIEREADYLPLIMQRINRRRDPVAYIKAAGEELGLFELDGDAS